MREHDGGFEVHAPAALAGFSSFLEVGVNTLSEGFAKIGLLRLKRTIGICIGRFENEYRQSGNTKTERGPQVFTFERGQENVVSSRPFSGI